MKGQSQMNDTSPQITKIMCEMIQKKTPSERAMMGCSMYDVSKRLVTQAILRENPNISKTELKQQLFLKFYKDDFSPEEREKILKRFAQRNE